MKRVLAWVLVAAMVAPAASTLAASHQNTVVKVGVEGTVTRGTAMHVAEGLEEAEERGVPLVLQLDTPGGLVEATLDINRELARADVPVLTYVGPQGAISQSAGTFMFLMGHPNGMAPSTQIGSAQPITSGAGGGTQNASEKVENFLVGQIRGIAERTERNQSLAELYITENLNQNETEARETGMNDHVAPSLGAFLDRVDGEEAIVGDDRVTLSTEDARVVEVEQGFVADLVDLVSNPQLVFVLFLIGLYGVIFGLAAPGTLVPETIGALSLLLALIGLGLFDTGTSGILLLLLAGTFFVAEVFTPTHGVLAVAGVVSLLLGAAFLVDEPLLGEAFLDTFRTVAVVMAVVSGGLVMGAVWLAVQTRNQPSATTMLGEEGTAKSRLDPDGAVGVHGERWEATAREGPIEAGEAVRVVDRDGLHLTVERAGEAA